MALDHGPAYGRRLMPSVLDELALEVPNKVYAAIPRTNSVKDGFRDVTFSDVSRMVNFMAWWVEERFGKGEKFETVAYVGIADLRGPIVFLALIKCGFKLGGFLMFTVATILGNTTIVYSPPFLVPDGTLVRDIMLQQKLRALLLPPSILEQLILEPNGVELIKGLDFLAYSGAPLSSSVGNQLSQFINVFSPYGSTETYPLPELATASEDWAWHEFSPHLKHEMQLFDPDEGTYELVVMSDESTKDTAAVYHNLPGSSGEFRTKDLFVRHEEKPQLFKYYGRKDDIITLSNGKKFNPIPLELNIQGDSSLKGVLVIGIGRPHPALLVEFTNPAEASIENLWPLIEKSNTLVPGQGHIHRGMVIAASPDVPFTRTGKGTIVRRLTEEAYRTRIEKLYADFREMGVQVPLETNPQTLKLLHDFLNEGIVPNHGNDTNDIVPSYVDSLPNIVRSGSTGFLGSHIIANLLLDPGITHVYCLNRSKNAPEKQAEVLMNLDEEKLKPLLPKLKYFNIELGRPRLALTDGQYDELVTNVDTIIFNAWKLDFALALRSFQPFLHSLVEVVKLANESERRTGILFVSSLSSVTAMAAVTTAPETPIEDPLAAAGMGYAQSKLAGERILTSANQKLGVPVCVVRICQLLGREAGAIRSDRSWISALVETSKTLKSIPKNVTRINFLRVNVAGRMIYDLLGSLTQDEAQFYHIAHPQPPPWELLVDALQERLGGVDVVPLQDWVDKLKSIDNPTAEDVEAMPALPLLDFFENLAKAPEYLAYATERATSTSGVKHSPIDRQYVEDWLGDWNM
ncbi:hypothetical protein ONZ43_g1633 [Nemania bipapillata]|uniref:Uncharacterized protein n=1 Tax=Nemania bipapillata TaxID=110536 RepID=A0ACC2J419_9PEZI|nr:hypothetical protein ONZ43_g1633 [Nemania bipapillata]